MAYLDRPELESRIYYRERGEGQPLVLINGLSQTTANWTSQVGALSEHYRVITWDNRGQGRSELGSGKLSLQAHVDDLSALLDALGIERAHVAGFSHGARVALAFAARCPERTDTVSLTSIGSDDSPYRNVIIQAWKETLRLGGVEALAWVSTTHILGREFLTEYADQMEVMIRTVMQRNTHEGLTAMLDGLAGYKPSLDEARAVKAPSQLITSTDDPLVSVDSAEKLAEALGTERHRVFDTCGHTIPVEEPEGWRAELLEFLSSVTGAGR